MNIILNQLLMVKISQLLAIFQSTATEQSRLIDQIQSEKKIPVASEM